MSARQHHALRAFGVLLLAIAALWPRSHATRQDHEVARHAVRSQFTTAAARPSADDVPRPRAAPVNASFVTDEVDESQLRN